MLKTFEYLQNTRWKKNAKRGLEKKTNGINRLLSRNIFYTIVNKSRYKNRNEFRNIFSSSVKFYVVYLRTYKKKQITRNSKQEVSNLSAYPYEWKQIKRNSEIQTKALTWHGQNNAKKKSKVPEPLTITGILFNDGKNELSAPWWIMTR